MKDNKKDMLRDLGFGDEMDNVDKGRCPLCGSYDVKYNDFKDTLSWKEFQNAGMCQECQDKAFE